jgi:hypothetical protein
MAVDVNTPVSTVDHSLQAGESFSIKVWISPLNFSQIPSLASSSVPSRTLNVSSENLATGPTGILAPPPAKKAEEKKKVEELATSDPFGDFQDFQTGDGSKWQAF